ncbi:hypothetical protein LCER1_G008549, partial [Lachnellula cervina]
MAKHPNTPSKTALPQDDLGEGPRKRNKANTPDFSQADTLVTFLIGPENEDVKPKTFIVHKEIVCYHSPVLNAAFNSGFVEGQTQTYKLDDVSEGVFKLLVQWLYSQKLTVQDLDQKKDFTAIYWQDRNLAALYVLADRLAMPSLQNLVLEKIEHLSDKSSTIPTHSFYYVYNNTSKDSPLRKFFVAMSGKYANEAFYDPVDDVQYYPHQFLLDLNGGTGYKQL